MCGLAAEGHTTRLYAPSQHTRLNTARCWPGAKASEEVVTQPARTKAGACDTQIPVGPRPPPQVQSLSCFLHR